jgi:hypothetical protein
MRNETRGATERAIETRKTEGILLGGLRRNSGKEMSDQEVRLAEESDGLNEDGGD